MYNDNKGKDVQVCQIALCTPQIFFKGFD